MDAATVIQSASRTEAGCLVPTVGHQVQSGHRQVHIANGKTKVAHRLVYEHLVGPVPDHLVLDHLCRNTECIEVEHLEVVTPGENVRRANFHRKGTRYAVKTHCPNGHEYTTDTVYDGPRGRECKVCRRERDKRRRR